MGHNIHFAEYSENVNKKQVQAEWDDYAAKEDWQEGCSGLGSDIRWIDHICESREEAEEYIRSHDKGWYDQLAVKFRKPTNESAKTKDLRTRMSIAYKKYNDLARKVHYAGCVSEFISCRACKSKIATHYIRSNLCPVCGADLRPATTIARETAAKAKAEELEKKLAAEQIKDAKKKGEIRWLVKIEYHT